LLSINSDSSDLSQNIDNFSGLFSPSSLSNSISTTAYGYASESSSNSNLTQQSTTTSLLSPISTSTPEQPTKSTTSRLTSTAATLALSSTQTPLPLLDTVLTQSVLLKLPRSSITPSTSYINNLITLPSSNPTLASSSTPTSLESTNSYPTTSSPMNVHSSTPILYTSEPFSTTLTPVISTPLYLPESTHNLDQPTQQAINLYLSSSSPTEVPSPVLSSVPLFNSIPSSELTLVPESASYSMPENNLSPALLELFLKLKALSETQ